MRRRDVLQKASTAGALVFGTTTVAAATRDGPDATEANYLVRVNDAGEEEVLDVSDLDEAEIADLRSPSTEVDCGSGDCTYYDCSDCPDICYHECGGCLCSVP